MKSVLIGNGFNIQFGNNIEKLGNAYNNRFILQRIKFNAKAGKYTTLFGNKIKGEDIVKAFSALVEYANKICFGEFDYISDDNDLKNAIDDFKCRYNYELQKPNEIGLEDWFLLIKLFFVDNLDIKDEWQYAKQAFEKIILDAIYNDGVIQNIYCSINKNVKQFFSSFKYLFTLNYDNNLENLTKREVYHLHGDYGVINDSENTDIIQGYINQKKGKYIKYPVEFKHCYCNALLNYSGNMKLKHANNIEKCQDMLKSLKVSYETDPNDFVNKFKSIGRLYEYIESYINNPNLAAGTNYHFKEFRELSGELVIIGMCPNNDSHIFECINNSNIKKVTFYHFYTKNNRKKPTLPLSKPYEVLDVNEKLWEPLKCKKKVYNGNEAKLRHPAIDKFINIFNDLSGDKITEKQFKDEFNAIPQFEADRLCELVEEELEKHHTGVNNEEELIQQLNDITRIGLREGVFPTVLYSIYVDRKNDIS